MHHAIPPSGAQFEIRHGDQRATVTEVGATLRSYQHGDRTLLDGFPANAMCDGSRGALLAPWPNRTAGGGWVGGDGSHHQLPVNEPRTGCALHGLVAWVPWRVAAHSDGAVSLECTLHPQPGYPFTLHLLARYALSDGGLHVSVTATNRGTEPAPYGIGHHPYIVCRHGVDAARLHIPAAARLDLDTRGIPTGSALDVAGTPYDFRIVRAVGALQLDTCYTALDRDGDGRVHVEVDDVALWMEPPFAWLMVYSGDTLQPERRRRSLAVEPMTCPPDALNSRQDVVVLPPGDECRTAWGLRLSASAGRARPS